jgi:hypothetical protein
MRIAGGAMRGHAMSAYGSVKLRVAAEKCAESVAWKMAKKETFIASTV